MSTTIVADPDDIRRYLDTVLGSGEGFLCVAIGTDPYLDGKGKYSHGHWFEHAFAWPSERDTAMTEITRNALTGDVYVCPYLMKELRRVKGNSVQRQLVHSDVDQDCDEQKVAGLGGFVVPSGSPGHGHVYIPLSWPVTPEQHEALCRGLAAHLGGDAKYCDNDLLRPPGTLNHKTTVDAEGIVDGADPTPVTVTWCGERTRVDPVIVADLLGVDLANPATANGDRRHAGSGRAEVVVDLDRYPSVRAALEHQTDDRSKTIRRKREKPFAAEYALLAELGLRRN